jgi:hypothetical protein
MNEDSYFHLKDIEVKQENNRHTFDQGGRLFLSVYIDDHGGLHRSWPIHGHQPH